MEASRVAAVAGHDRLETTTAQPARMRAIVQDRYGGLEVLELEDIDRPVPMDDQVLVRSIGADHVIDYTREDVTDGTRHWDLIVDTAGHRSLSRLRRALTPRGTLVIVGSEGRGRWLGGFDRNLRALALSRFVSQRLRMLSSKPRPEDLRTLRELLEAGKVSPAVDRTYLLHEVPEAIRYLVEGHGGGKVAITPLA